MPINKEVQILGVKFNGQLITSVKISGKDFTRENIEAEVSKLAAKRPDREFQVVLPYENWKSGSWFKAGQQISLFSLLDHYDASELPEDADPQKFNKFIIYGRAHSKLAGGCDNGLNDCLYQCLWKAYGTRWHLPQTFKSPADLKTFLGLSRSDLVPVNLISKLEKTIGMNVTGDAIYHSNSRSCRQITLVLSNGHYSIAKNPKRKRVQLWSKVAKNLIVFHADTVKNSVKFYDGCKFSIGTVKELTALKSYRWSGDLCLISVEKKKDGNMETLEEAFNRFNADAKALLQETKKEYLPIDLKLCGGSYKIASVWLFSKLSRGIRENEPLEPLEAKWISDAMKGGLIWAENDWKGHGEQYDVTSLYPYLMRKMTWPICKGKFQSVEDFEYENRGIKMIYYGIFKATIEEKKEAKKLFRYNLSGLYTHLDLKRAKALGLTITLDKSTPNALIYNSNTKCPGETMFGAYIDFLFKIKNSNTSASSPAKRILNTLWGALSQRKHSYTLIGKGTKYTSDSPFEPLEGYMLEEIIPYSEDQWRVTCKHPADIFEGEYPRIAPFLLAFGRKTISEIMEPYADQLKRVHTDGFILEKQGKSRSITVSENATKTLGSLKFEKEGYCTVKNAMQVIWH